MPSYDEPKTERNENGTVRLCVPGHVILDKILHGSEKLDSY
jgi:hypothetical protein